MSLTKLRGVTRGHRCTKTIYQSLLLICFVITNLTLSSRLANAQRSLHHWKRDLELRLKLYQDQRNEINNIIASAIHPPGRGAPLAANVKLSSGGNVRFSELIVPTGSLILESHSAEPTVRVLYDRTRNYIDYKMRELSSAQKHLGDIEHRLGDRAYQFIYKGLKGVPQPRYNFSGTITGLRTFNQIQFANFIESAKVSLPHVNRTDVNRAIDETYLRSSRVRAPLDPYGRLFFEGRKTFYKSVFTGPLRSGCCDRMRPLHTNRMMFRSLDQEILAPLVLVTQTNQTGYAPPSVVIRNLETRQISNQHFALGGAPQYPNSLSPTGLTFYSPPENIIRLPNLISLHRPDQPKALKTLVFKDIVTIQDVHLANSFSDSRFVVGIGVNMANPQSTPRTHFDISHDNYLLRFVNSINYVPEQLISGTTILESETSFPAGIEAQSVNQIGDFGRFVREILVRVDRRAIINGPVQFNAILPLLYGPNSQYNPRTPVPAANMLLVKIQPSLQVGLVNGMRVPQDIVILPSRLDLPNSPTIKPYELIHVYGHRRFSNQLLANDFARVSGLVNGMQLPETVIPLHLNDFVSSVGHSNLIFVDGLKLDQLTIQGGRFDDIILRDVFVDAQSLVMNSVFPRQSDGSILVRAPLRVMNLNLFSGAGFNRGLLNGFRPHEVIQLSRYSIEELHGRKTFLAPLEASECIFNDINNVADWTNQLIRIDRPNTIQTVYSRLAFTNSTMIGYYNSTTNQTELPSSNMGNVSSLKVDHFDVEFHKGPETLHYLNNWRLSPEFYLMHEALFRHAAGSNQTGGRYRCQNVKLVKPQAMVNNVALSDIVTLNEPFQFRKQFTMVGKVEMAHSDLKARRIQSNYPIDQLDLVQFNSQRIPVFGSRQPIRLNSLALGQENKASFVRSRLINGISFTQFANSIMSLTKPQIVESELVFNSPISFEAPFGTSSALNGIKNFKQFAKSLKSARYVFEDGIQCNAVVIKT